MKHEAFVVISKTFKGEKARGRDVTFTCALYNRNI